MINYFHFINIQTTKGKNMKTNCYVLEPQPKPFLLAKLTWTWQLHQPERQSQLEDQ